MRFVFLAGAVFLASVLRLWGITSGLPYVPIHVDEVTLVYTALSLAVFSGVLWTVGSGLFVPDYLFILYLGYFAIGKLVGIFTTPESFLVAYLNDPSQLILIGRFVTALCGVASVFAIYHIGKKWFSLRVGLLAAWFLAVAFLHVKESHYIKGDILAGLVVLLIFDTACKIAKKGEIRNYIIGGILSGLAFGVKYFPVLSSSMLVLAHIIYTRKIKVGILNASIFLLIILAIVTIFLLAAPTFLLRADFFGEFLMWANAVRGDAVSPDPVALTFLFGYISPGLGTLMFVISILGVFVALLRARQHQYLLLVFFPIFFLVTAEFWAKYSVARYAIVLFPSFVILAAIGVDFLLSFLPFRKLKQVATITLALTIIVPTLIRSMKSDSYMSSHDTRALAKHWIEQNIAGGTKIVNEGSLKPYVPAGGAPLFLSPEATEREIERGHRFGLPVVYLKVLLEVNSQRVGYDIYSTPTIIWQYDIETREHKELKDVSYFKDEGYTYIVTDSWAHPTAGDEFVKSLEAAYEKVAEFKPTVDFTSGPHDTFIEYDRVDEIKLLGGNISGPTVKVYKQRSN